MITKAKLRALRNTTSVEEFIDLIDNLSEREFRSFHAILRSQKIKQERKKPNSHQSIAEAMGLSKTRVIQLEQSGLYKMSRNTELAQLMGLKS